MLNNKIDFQVVIIGAGPAGLSTALYLVKKSPEISSQIIVFEKSTHPRDKVCGGGITPFADKWLNELDINLPENTLQLKSNKIIINKEEYNSGLFRTLPRKEFDNLLYDSAIKKGIIISQNESLLSFDYENNYVLVQTNKREIKTNIIVAADGTQSKTRSTLLNILSLNQPNRIIRGLKVHKKVDKENCLEHINLESIIDFDSGSKNYLSGYAWSFPFIMNEGHYLNIGVVDSNISNSNNSQSMLPALTEFIKNKNLSINKEELSSSPIRWFHPDSIFSGNNVLFVGDAAGVDPLIGDGISFSLGYGDVASQSIINAINKNDFSFSSYKDSLLSHETGIQLSQRLQLAEEYYCENKTTNLIKFISLPENEIQIPKDQDNFHKKNKIEKFFQIIRIKNWWDCKIPQLLAFAYMAFLIQPITITEAMLDYFSISLLLICLFVFGYAVNDLSDIEEDRRSGKSNLLGNYSISKRIIILLSPITIAFSILIYFYNNMSLTILFAYNFILPLLYSVKPFRFKERGILGIITDAAQVHGIPALFILMFVLKFPIQNNNLSYDKILLINICVLWSFIYGIRGIILHQLWDLKNDTKAGIKTFIRQVNSNKICSITKKYIFPFEISLLIIVATLLTEYSLLIVIAALLYMFFDFIKLRYVWKESYDPVPVNSGKYIPPSDFYEVWLPISFLIALTFSNIGFGILLLLHLVFFYKNIWTRIKTIISLIEFSMKEGRKIYKLIKSSLLFFNYF